MTSHCEAYPVSDSSEDEDTNIKIKLNYYKKELSKLQKIQNNLKFPEYLSPHQKYLYRELQKNIKVQLSNYPKILEAYDLFNYFNDSASIFFITITYDPKRFPATLDCIEEEYIKYVLLTIYIYNITAIYGTFEKHENGRVHTHLVLQAYQQKEIEITLKSMFGSTLRRSNISVKIEKIKPNYVQDALDYINKTNKPEEIGHEFYIIHTKKENFDKSDEEIIKDNIQKYEAWLTINQLNPLRTKE